MQCNVHVLMTAQEDPGVMRALDEAWCVMPDGAPVAWLMRRLGAARARRIGGPDLMPLVIDRGQRHNLRHAFIGSMPEVLEALTAGLATRYPGIRIVGTISPPFGDPTNWSEGLVAHVSELDAQVVWLALGAPKQEHWLAIHAAQLSPALALGVGAAFDFHAGAKQRAPDVMGQLGLEWLYRMFSEPRRLTGRYATSNTAFILRLPAVMRANREGGWW